MTKYIYYVSFGEKKMKTEILASNRLEADKIIKEKLVILKVVEPTDYFQKINDMMLDFDSLLCSNPLHKVQIASKGFCSTCKVRKKEISKQ